MAEIKKNVEIREIKSKYLYYVDEDGNIDKTKENEQYQVTIFEGDIVRLALQDRNEEKANYQLLDEIIYMEIFHNDIMWQIIRDGIRIANEDYILYSATTGQVRNMTITLMKKSFFKKHKDYLFVGLSDEKINANGGMNVGKYISYNALPLSSSVLPEKEIDIDKCMVVKGLETIVTSKVKFIDIQEDSNGQYNVVDTPKDYIEKDIEVEHTDGAGMFLPGELPSSCQIRGGYFKGAIFPFDFRLFSKDIADNSIVEDAWGKTVDIDKEDIRFILTTSQLKMWKQYNSWEEYKKVFKQNNLKISINSYANPAKETVNFSYQYLQTLPYGCDIRRICNPAKEDLIKLHTDLEYTKEVMGYTNDSEIQENVALTNKPECEVSISKNSSSNSLLAEAISIYPPLIYDSYITTKIKKMVQSKSKSYRGGKIPIKGYYSYAAPDMYAFCEYLFCKNKDPQGLVPRNHIYNRYYDDKGSVENVICLRSPHLSRYEYGKRKLIKSDICRQWFKYMGSDTIVSCHDLLSTTLQMDWDGDEILVSDDEELYNLAKELPDEPLYYNMQQAEPQMITKEAIYDTLVKGFDNNVIGDSSNATTKLWNTHYASKENTIPYDDAINVFCAYSNYAIDYPKTGKSLNLGVYEELYNELVSTRDTKNVFAESEIKHPNFFIEAKNKKRRNVAKPTENVMDRVKKYISDGTGKLKYTYLEDAEQSEFDYRMLMNNEADLNNKAKFEVDRYNTKYQKLYLVLKNRKLYKRAICNSIDKEEQRRNMDSIEKTARFETFHYYCIREIKEIFTNKDGWFNVNLAVNYFIDMEYTQHEFITSSKDILWKCFGHIIIDNLYRNIEGNITLRYRPRKAYVKAQRGDRELDNRIIQKMESRSVGIGENDLNKLTAIKHSLPKYKNGKIHSNDEELLFVLYCLYKEAQAKQRLKDGYLIITKRKHIKDYDSNSNTKKKRKVKFNINKVMQIAGAKSYIGSFNRFMETEEIEIIDDKEKECFKIKIGISQTEGKILFTVNNIYNSLIYLQSYNQGKCLCKCNICGNEFIKIYNNQKTCGDKCKDTLHRLNQAKVNEKNRKIILESKKVI